jgi:hypothetical protein
MKKFKNLNDLYNGLCDFEVYNNIKKDDLLNIAKELIYTLTVYEPSEYVEGVLMDMINDDILYIEED